jgi:hypothetical protein
MQGRRQPRQRHAAEHAAMVQAECELRALGHDGVANDAGELLSMFDDESDA